MKVENVFSFELSPVPTYTVDDTGDMGSSKSESSLNKISKKVSFQPMKKAEFVVTDGCALLWVVNWPTNELVFDYIVNYFDFLFWL